MINQTLCTSFKRQLMLGVHDFRVTGGDVFKVALYTSAASLGADTIQYTTAGECVGAGYTAGGATLTNMGVLSTGGDVSFTSFPNVTFPNVTLTARAALVYNTTPSAANNSNIPLLNPAVCVLDFGEEKTVVAKDFTIVFPAFAANTALIRIA